MLTKSNYNENITSAELAPVFIKAKSGPTHLPHLSVLCLHNVSALAFHNCVHRVAVCGAMGQAPTARSPQDPIGGHWRPLALLVVPGWGAAAGVFRSGMMSARCSRNELNGPQPSIVPNPGKSRQCWRWAKVGRAYLLTPEEGGGGHFPL